MRKIVFAFCSIVVYLMCSGCASPNGNWGAKSSITPGWQHLKYSAEKALKDPQTWMPIAGAAAFSLGSLDHKTVKWASEHTPLYGSKKDAKDTSDDLRELATINYVVTALATPSGKGYEGLKNKTRGLLFGAMALRINHYTSQSIKSYANRTRPLENTSTDSFPSLHTSSTSIAATLASRNISHTQMNTTQKRVWQWSGHIVSGLTGWARLEAGVHYPSDILTGYALGNFLGVFLNDAFITPEKQDDYHITLFTNTNGDVEFTFGMRF